jgi:hypothetical protein
MRSLKTIWSVCALLGMLHVSIPARSQGPDTNTQTPGSAPAQPPTAAASPVVDQPLLKPAELEALVAPIALYPDTLLANVLMASTYPLEVVRAERWVNQNKNLKDDALKAAAEKQPWDGSIKSLVAAPAVLQLLNERLEWTQKLGEAFLAQEKDVMDAVQRMRARAYDRKKLVTTKQQVVSVREEQSRQVIFIDPAEAENLYVPWYEPPIVYGDWPYSDYPAYPYYWGYPGYIAGGPASPIAVDGWAVAGKLAIERGRETALFREPEISGPRRASVRVAGPGSPAAAADGRRHSAAAAAGEALAVVAAVAAVVAAVGAARTSS